MNVKNVEKENGKAVITLEIAKDEFEAALNKAYLKLKKSIQIPGFRKGKAPRKMVESLYGPEVFYEDAIEGIFPEIYTAAIVDQNLKAVGQPSMVNMEKNEEGAMVLTLSTELYPEVTLGQYKGLEVTKAEAVVTDEEVAADLNRMAEQSARIATVERAAKNGDTVVLDFEGFVNGVPFEGGKAEGHNLELGSGAFIPGFEAQLEGLSAGESKDVVVTFPADYSAAELAGKEATFKCTVHEVKEKVMPELDDEFAKDVSEFDTLEELKADLKAKALQEKEAGIQSAFENACIGKAVENMTAEIPACMIEDQIDKQLEEFGYQMQSSGLSMDDYVKMMGGDISKLRDSLRPMAENNVKASVMIAAIIEAENIEVTDEEVDAEVAKVAEQFKMDVAQVKEYLPMESVKSDLCSRKAVKLIADSAVATAPAQEV